MLTTRLLPLLLMSISINAYALDYKLQQSSKLPSNCFTQGFIKTKHHFYISCGKYRQSRLLKLSLDGKTLKQYTFSDGIFAEGIAINNNILLALSWKENKAFEFDLHSLKLKKEYFMKGQGWGLTRYKNDWLKSDGSSNLSLYRKDSLALIQSFTLKDSNGKPTRSVNELEICQNILFANIWKSNTILMFKLPLQAENTAFEKLNITPLSEAHKHQGVANGLACEKGSDQIWVTGKNWGKAYAITLPDLQGW